MMKKLLIVGLLPLWAASSVSAQHNVWRTDSLQEVVVTGTGTQHLLKDAPVQTEVITRQMLRQYGGSSLQDILSGLTSSFAFNESDMGAQMQMNGLGNGYILILVDGKRMHGDNGGENDLSLIDPHNIEKIEIVKGASSALYGSDAIAGVVNIITRRHEGGLLAENISRVGSYADLRQHNALAFTVGKLTSQTNFNLQHSDGWQNTATEDPRQTEFLVSDSRNKTVNRHTNWQISERLCYKPSANSEIYAEGSTYWKRIYRPSGKYAAIDVKTYDMSYRNQSLAAGAKWKMKEKNMLTLDVNWDRHAYYYDFTATTLTDGIDPLGNFTPYFPYFSGDKEVQSDQRRTMAQLKGVFALPANNQLSAGLEWRHDLLKAPMRVADGEASDHTEALYVQDEWRVDCGHAITTHLTGGLRLTNNGHAGRRLTPKLSAMMAIGDAWRIRATWSQGFKTPTPKELYYRYIRYMNGTYLYLGNDELKPQTSNYLSLGGEWNWKGINVALTGYMNNVDRMIALVTIPNSQAPGYYIATYDPTKTRQYQNLESAKTRGVDLSVRYRINREWSAGLSYSYLDTDAEHYDADHERLQKIVIDGTAHHKGSWFATWKHELKRGGTQEKREERIVPTLGLGLYGRMSSKRYYQINGDGKGYQIWRITGTYSFGLPKKQSAHLQPLASTLFIIEAGIDNIFDYCDRTPHGLHLGTTTPGRTVYATLTVRFNKGKKLKFNNINNKTSKHQDNEQD